MKKGRKRSIHFIFLELKTRISAGCSGDGTEHLILPLCVSGGKPVHPHRAPTIRYVLCRMMYDLDGRQEVENEPAALCTHAGSMTNHRSSMRWPRPASPPMIHFQSTRSRQTDSSRVDQLNGLHSLRICFRLFVDRGRVFDVWPLLGGQQLFSLCRRLSRLAQSHERAVELLFH
jgi:hypothetical protein